MSILKTKYDFVLPKGYLDKQGNLHKNGTMRLATGGDMVVPSGEPEVRRNEAYYPVFLLSRVIISLGTLEKVTKDVILGLYLNDYAFLVEMYNQINNSSAKTIVQKCPQCEKDFDPFTNPKTDEVQTEFEFTLPVGYVDSTDNLHKQGTMRLATLEDEIKIAGASTVQENERYADIICLTRTIVSLGSLTAKNMNNHLIESIFEQDILYLWEMYRKINQIGAQNMELVCPSCSHVSAREHEYPGELPSTPSNSSKRR